MSFVEKRLSDDYNCSRSSVFATEEKVLDHIGSFIWRGATLGLAIAATAGSAQPVESPGTADPCQDTEIRALLPNLACVAGKHGFALAARAEAAGIAATIDGAAGSFARHFEGPRRPIAVVASTNVTREQIALLKRKGFATLPWLGSEDRRKVQEASVRKQLESQMAALPVEQREAALNRVLAHVQDKSPSAETLSHELAHNWFRQFYDPDPPPAGTSAPESKFRYGSSAADWLDEMAAVLAEGDTITKSRRELLPKTVQSDEIRPLAEFFAMEHPMLRRARDGAPEDCKGVCVRMLTGADASKALEESKGAGAFYIQSRAFADFMLERSGNQRVFLEIARHTRNGGDIDAWLAANGQQQNLPTSVARLQTEWDVWLSRKTP